MAAPKSFPPAASPAIPTCRAAARWWYAQNAAGTGGTLTVSDGRHAAAIALLGNYIAGSFVLGADGHGGTLVSEASQTAQPLLTRPQA